LDAAPVPAVEGIAADEVEGAGHGPLAAPAYHQQDAIRHRRGDEAEEPPVEVGAPPLAAAGIHVEVEERVPVRLGEVGAADQVDLDAFCGRLAPYAHDRLALA